MMNNFDPNEFFKDEPVEIGRTGHVAGGIGAWILHIAKVTFLLYSGAHAINATLNYAGSSDWAKAMQIVGIVTLEAVLFGIYLAWHNGRIVGAAQSLTAGVIYAIGFTLACLGIVADSQINAGTAVRSWLTFYLYWGLPVAPAVMALGAVLVSELAPDKLRQRRQKNERDALDDERFRATLANQRAELKEAQTLRAMQLASRQAVLQELHRVYTGADVQRAIAATATGNAPALLRAAGIHVEDVPDVNGNGEFDMEDLVSYLVEERLRQQGRPNGEPVVIPTDGNGAANGSIDPRAPYRVAYQGGEGDWWYGRADVYLTLDEAIHAADSKFARDSGKVPYRVTDKDSNVMYYASSKNNAHTSANFTQRPNGRP